MGSFATMAFVFGIVAVLLIGVFMFLWTRDKGRSNDVADNPERLDTEPTPHDKPTNGR
ncbi:MAG TPA: hypothetical protein VFG72_10615 [Marmoricola sp.]|nr:hypothetical protein [Marmoricola sp.]